MNNTLLSHWSEQALRHHNVRPMVAGDAVPSILSYPIEDNSRANNHASLLACDFQMLMNKLDTRIPPTVLWEHIAEHFSQCSTEYFIKLLVRIKQDEMQFHVSLRHVLTVFGALSLFVMQAGFVLMEVTQIRSTNINELLISNTINIAVSTVMYFLIGHALHLGKDVAHIVGSSWWLLLGVEEPSLSVYWWAVCAVFLCIASCTLVGRLCLTAQLLCSSLLAGVVFPVAAHWTWAPEGWLRKGLIPVGFTSSRTTVSTGTIGLLDLGGATTVHVAGGAVALMGSLVLGRRRTRLDTIDVSSFPPSSPALLCLAHVFLLIGYLAFHASAVYANDHIFYESPEESVEEAEDRRLAQLGIALVATLSSAAAATLSTLLMELVAFRRRLGYRLLLDLVHGALAGTVSASAAAHEMAAWAALMAGAVGGVIRCFWTKIFYMTGLEDPCDITAVHLGCGIWAALSSALLSGRRGLASGDVVLAGKQLGWQALGVLTVGLWASLLSLVPLLFLRLLKCLRSVRDTREHRLAQEDDKIRLRDAEEGGVGFFKFNDDPETMYELLLRNPWNRARYTQELFWRLLDNFRIAGPASISRETSENEQSTIPFMGGHGAVPHHLQRPPFHHSGPGTEINSGLISPKKHSKGSVKPSHKYH